MSELTWSWLSAPFFACAIAMVAVAIIGVFVRGDRVMRLGVIGAAVTGLPWAVTSGLAACTQDPEVAGRLMRLGQGPVALVGPNLLLVLLGASGQLERHRWIVRGAAILGVIMLAVCWATPWTVPGAQRLSSGLLYMGVGPLTDLHLGLLGAWLFVGLFIVRRSSTQGERRRLTRTWTMVVILGGMGIIDLLVIHGVWGGYPLTWLPSILASAIAIYLVLYTNLLRPQGVDRAAVIEAAAFVGAAIAIAAIAFAFAGSDPVTTVVLASGVWGVVLGVSWRVAGAQPVRVARERALEQFVARLADVEDEAVIVERLTALWKAIGVDLKRVWRAHGEELVEMSTEAAWRLDPEVAAWLVEHGAISPGELATMRIGPVRPKIEALLADHGATLVVPLIDRGDVVGLVEADHANVLTEEERGLIAESARAAARAVTYASLAYEAALEGETAREVEVAEAMRLQVAASRDDELGTWSVAVEYRSAPRTTGAVWSASLLPDGRLAVMVTEAQAHGVAAALATAALTGAFAAATTGVAKLELDDLVTSLRASAEGVMRGGEPIAAFLAVLDAERRRIAWACAGHPGAYLVGPVAYDLSQFPAGSGTGPRPNTTPLGGGGVALGASLVQATRGQVELLPDTLLVIASSAVRGADEAQWQAQLREQAPAGPRLATVLVETASRRAEVSEDFLAVVVRQRPDRRSEPLIST